MKLRARELIIAAKQSSLNKQQAQSAPTDNEDDLKMKVSLANTGSTQNYEGISFVNKIDPDNLRSSIVSPDCQETYNGYPLLKKGSTDSIEKRLLALMQKKNGLGNGI